MVTELESRLRRLAELEPDHAAVLLAAADAVATIAAASEEFRRLFLDIEPPY